MKQIKVWHQIGFTDDVVGRVLLEARAGQVPHIYGYHLAHINIGGSGFRDLGDMMEAHLTLLAAPRAPAVPIGLGTGDLDTYLNTRGVVGYLGTVFELIGPTNVSQSPIKMTDQGPWVPCDFEVPGLWLAMWDEGGSGVPPMEATITVLFDWVNRSPLQVAALYTSYGIDAVDATEREVTGQVDFNRVPGIGGVTGGVIG